MLSILKPRMLPTHAEAKNSNAFNAEAKDAGNAEAKDFNSVNNK